MCQGEPGGTTWEQRDGSGGAAGGQRGSSGGTAGEPREHHGRDPLWTFLWDSYLLPLEPSSETLLGKNKKFKEFQARS